MRRPVGRAAAKGTVGVLAALGMLVVLLRPAAAIDIHKVVSDKGVVAWFVPDHSVPLIALTFAFRGAGSATDPDGKEGLANMVSGLLDEGAGDLKSEAFQTALEEIAAELSFDTGRDNFQGRLRTLKSERDRAFDLLRLAVTKPRFDDRPVNRVRGQILANIEQEAEDPDHIARDRWREIVFAGHPYAKPHDGTKQSVAAITVADLRGFVQQRFGRDRLVVGVVGDISEAELKQRLDEVFGDLPATTAKFDIPDTAPAGGGRTIVVRKPIPQSVIVLGEQGPKRNDPDWYAATLVTRILGGGALSSRLYEEVREKRGLAYSVYAYLNPLDHAGLLVGGTGTQSARAGESLDVIRHEWEKIGESGVTAAELRDAKTYVNGSFALRLDSTRRIANILVVVQLSRLGIDYLGRRSALMDGVTLGQANRVARRLFRADALTVVVVGDPKGIAATP